MGKNALIKKLTQFQTLAFKKLCDGVRRGNSHSFYDAVNRITRTYGAWIETHSDVGGDAIYDETDLPYPKMVILKSLMMAAAFPADTNTQNAIEVSAMHLAACRKGVGSKPLYLLGAPFRELNKLDQRECLKHHASESDMASAALARRHQLELLIDNEEAQILVLIEFAKKVIPKQLVSLMTALPDSITIQSMIDMFSSEEEVENRLQKLKKDTAKLLQKN